MNKKEKERLYYLVHQEEIKERVRNYYWEHRDEINLKRRGQKRTYKHVIRDRDKVRRLKEEVLTHYGGGKLACIKCGFDDLRALSLDHIYGGGNKEKSRGITAYYKLKRKDYPEGYQTLCMNCQFIKRHVNREWN